MLAVFSRLTRLARWCVDRPSYDVDFSAHYRKKKPEVFGWYPEAKAQRILMFGVTTLQVLWRETVFLFALNKRAENGW